MQDIQGIVGQVEGRNTRGGRTIYDIPINGEKYTTFENPLATKAAQFQGQTVDARIEVTQNGQYTNKNLKDIAAVGQLPPLAMPVGAPVAAPAAAPGAPPPNIPIVSGGGGRNSDPHLNQRIARQNANNTAAIIAASLFQGAGPEAAQEAFEVFKGYQERIEARNNAIGQQQVAPPPATPDGVAQAVNAEAGAGAVRVGAPAPQAAPAVAW